MKIPSLCSMTAAIHTPKAALVAAIFFGLSFGASSALATLPGTATVIANAYGPLAVTGATLTGNTITNFSGNTLIQLGTVPGTTNSTIQIDFQGLNLGPGNVLTIRSGAANQSVYFYNTDASASTIAGTLQMQSGNGAAAPQLRIQNPNGITVSVGGSITALSGLSVMTLGSVPTAGQNLVNQGLLDGGVNLSVYGARINGGGAYKGNYVLVSTFGSANNPVNGSNYLLNGLQIYPSSGGEVTVALNAYGSAPQVMNMMINGNGYLWMPSAWPSGWTLPQNSNPVAPNGIRPPGVPEPAYGGGSMIMQATGYLTLVGGGPNDFAFPGAIVLKAGGTLDINAVIVNQGWTTSGQPFQGIFFESPNIISPAGNIQVYGNNLNWVNFSTLPHAAVRAFSLTSNSDGSASFKPADASIPHMNTYSVITGLSVSGGCWLCAINTQPVNVYDGTSLLLIQAWNPDGTVAGINDFQNYTDYVTGPWSMRTNYGVFPIGKSPATPQVGSFAFPVNVSGVDYIAIEVPNNHPLYFTALWKAPVIGTVFMRADNAGAGFVTSSSQPQKLEIPYEFALAEYQKAKTLVPGNSLTPEAQGLLSQATAAIDAAKNAATPAARALAAYTALSFVMPLKERLVLDASNKSNATAGPRADFDLNYEGFGSWTGSSFVPGYMVAKDAGFKSVYTIVDWVATSPAQGTYDFSALDYQIDQAEQLGFKVALQVNWNFGQLPAWAQALSFDDLKALYYENARVVVARYGSRVSLYYACGELELQTGPLTLDQLTELARQSLNGARTAAPTMPFGIYVSASAYVGDQINPPNYPHFSGLTLLGYLSKNNVNFDFLAQEMQYGTVFAPIDLQRFQEVLQDVYSVAKIPIYMGETGYSSKSEDYGITSNFFWHGGLTQQAQYEWADGTLRILYAMPFIKGYYWVHLDPDDNASLPVLVGTNFVRPDGTVKKVSKAFKDFNSQIGAPAAGASARH